MFTRIAPRYKCTSSMASDQSLSPRCRRSLLRRFRCITVPILRRQNIAFFISLIRSGPCGLPALFKPCLSTAARYRACILLRPDIESFSASPVAAARRDAHSYPSFPRSILSISSPHCAHALHSRHALSCDRRISSLARCSRCICVVVLDVWGAIARPRGHTSTYRSFLTVDS